MSDNIQGEIYHSDKDTPNLKYDTDLTSEEDSDWNQIKYLPLPEVIEKFKNEIITSRDKGLRSSFRGNATMISKQKAQGKMKYTNSNTFLPVMILCLS